MNPLRVEVMRGAALESAHRGALAVLDADGAVLAAIGDVQRPIFPRSAVKVLQALALVESGAADRLGLGDDDPAGPSQPRCANFAPAGRPAQNAANVARISARVSVA